VNPTNWFSTVCAKVHPIVWAKVTGYPIWPGKAISQNRDPKSNKIQIDVKFFGQHDRSLVPATNVYCMSKDEPSPKVRIFSL
jgi:hypothetical protein